MGRKTLTQSHGYLAVIAIVVIATVVVAALVVVAAALNNAPAAAAAVTTTRNVITFDVSRRRHEISVCVCVCVSVCLSVHGRDPHYCMDPDVTWGSGRGYIIGRICNRGMGCIAVAT